jgi:large subunit ribosomal protein L23
MPRGPHNVILGPVVTEKSTDLQRSRTYVFRVPVDANKVEIRLATEVLFGVQVQKVRTLRVRPKWRTWRGRQVGTTPRWKKAIVKLREGQTIDKLGVG